MTCSYENMGRAPGDTCECLGCATARGAPSTVPWAAASTPSRVQPSSSSVPRSLAPETGSGVLGPGPSSVFTLTSSDALASPQVSLNAGESSDPGGSAAGSSVPSGPIPAPRRAHSPPQLLGGWTDEPSRGLDERITIGGGSGTIRALLTCLRKAGVHSDDATDPDDASLADGLLRSFQAHRARARGKQLGAGPWSDAVTPEESVAANASFGVAEGTFPRNGSDDILECGDYVDMVNDLVAMGAGTVRRVKDRDLFWASLFPDPDFQHGETIASPGDIQARIAANNYEVLRPFKNLLLVSGTAGLKIAPTLFNGGGGYTINSMTETDSEEFIDGTDVLNSTLDTARPPQLQNYLIGSYRGWDEYYWNFEGFSFLRPQDEALAALFPDLEAAVAGPQKDYQRFAINVWPTDDTDDLSSTSSPYMRECCRRKALGLASFADAIGQFLSKVHLGLKAWSTTASLYRVLDAFELGNEFNNFYVQPNTTEVPSDLSPEELVAAVQLRTDALFYSPISAKEAGRYFALLAGPIHLHLPNARFRACELGSGNTEEFPDQCDWLRMVVETGMPTEVDRWRASQAMYFVANSTGVDTWITDSMRAWYGSSIQGGSFFWPPLTPDMSTYMTVSARDLVHQLGFHWFHNLDTKGTARVWAPRDWHDFGFTYLDECHLGALSMEFDTRVLTPLASEFTLGRTLGASGFPSRQPSAPGDNSSFYADASGPEQAAMLIRRLATARGLGFEVASWFTFLNGPKSATELVTSLQTFDTMSLHNDVNDGHHKQGDNAWPRPAWFAYRRLMWLLSVAPDVEVASAERGFVILRFTAAGAGIALSPEGEAYHAPFKYAYMAWVDQHSGAAEINPDGTRSGGGSFELVDVSGADAPSHALSMVPSVSAPTGDVDENGYAVVTPDWHWAGWNAAARVSSVNGTFDGGGFTIISVDVAVADPQANIAPLLLLSNAASCTVLD